MPHHSGHRSRASGKYHILHPCHRHSYVDTKPITTSSPGDSAYSIAWPSWPVATRWSSRFAGPDDGHTVHAATYGSSSPRVQCQGTSMGHSLQTLLGPVAAMHEAAAKVPEARCVTIGIIGLVPMTPELFDALNDPASPMIEPFHLMTWAVRDRFADLIGSSPFGYIETEYFGGVGTQSGCAWRGGTLIVRPAEADGSVNSVLRALGVLRVRGRDEWDTVGLAQFRSMDDLLAAVHLPVPRRLP